MVSSDKAINEQLLLSHSTNLTQLRADPIGALVTSAFFVGTPWLILLWLVFFPVVVASAERWLGSLRLVAAFVAGHVGATTLRAVLLANLATHRSLAMNANKIDVGASYGFAGVVGVMTFRFRRPWNWCWIVGWFVGIAVVTAVAHSVPMGHLAALLLGLACYPFTRSAIVRRRRGDPLWSPPDWAVESSRRWIDGSERRHVG
jgi:hypothetical protein